MNCLNYNANIMTQNFTKDFVDLSDVTLTENRVAKLPFDHAEGGFYVTTFVVMLHELLTPEHEIVVHFGPSRIVSR